MFIANLLWKTSGQKNYAERIAQQKRIRKRLTTSNANLFFESRHLRYLAALVGVGVIVANLVDYQFNAVASEAIDHEDKLTAFFGFWLSNLSIASLIIQLLLTSRILKYFGVSASLLFLPAGIFIGALCMLFNPALWAAVLIKLSDGGFKQSINKAGLELLYLPIPTDIKNQGKTFIDIFVDSLATGIGGILLIIFARNMGLPVQYLSILIILLIFVWFWLISKTKHEYINSFRLALEQRTIDLEEQTVNIKDGSVFQSLAEILEGNNEKQIIYVLNLIENDGHEAFFPYLKKCLEHSSNEIKIKILDILNQNKIKDFRQQVSPLIYADNFQIQTRAIQYIYRDTRDDDILHRLLTHFNYSVRSAALLIAAEEFRVNKDFRKQYDMKILLEEFVGYLYHSDTGHKEKIFMKVVLARVIGKTRDPNYYSYLTDLLVDQSIPVIIAAVQNAGNTRHPQFIPILIRHLNTKRVRRYARRALAEYENAVIAPLEDYMANINGDRQIRMGIPKVLALVATQSSVDLLMSQLDQSDLMLRSQVIKALNKLRGNYPLLKFNKSTILNRISKESEKYFKTLALFKLQKQFFKELPADPSHLDVESVHQAGALLLRAIQERLEDNLERIFRLLGLIYSSQDIHNAYHAITSERPNLRANAIEFLDNVLDINLKKMVLPIIENRSSPKLDSQPFSDMSPDTEMQIFFVILEEDDNWIKVCVLFFMIKAEIPVPAWIVEKLTTDPDPMVRETAKYVKESNYPKNSFMD
jgi:AAA family ATP:ADP antiporter